MRKNGNKLKTLLIAASALVVLGAPVAMAVPPDGPNNPDQEDNKCPGPWDLQDVNEWRDVSYQHPNTCADQSPMMQLEGQEHWVFKMKDCGDGEVKLNLHISHGKAFSRTQRRIPEGHEGYLGPEDDGYVTDEELQVWLSEHPVEDGQDRPMPPGWYETIWNSNGILNLNQTMNVGAPNNMVFICHFVTHSYRDSTDNHFPPGQNPYTGVKEDYLWHQNQHWTVSEDLQVDFQNINMFETCPGQGGTMTKICIPGVDPNCRTE